MLAAGQDVVAFALHGSQPPLLDGLRTRQRRLLQARNGNRSTQQKGHDAEQGAHSDDCRQKRKPGMIWELLLTS